MNTAQNQGGGGWFRRYLTVDSSQSVSPEPPGSLALFLASQAAEAGAHCFWKDVRPHSISWFE